MGVGSVPQTLRALLSISDSYSLVLSADCIRGCDSQHAHYALGITSMDSSDNQDATVDFYRCRASGLVMSDHLALGDATIPDQRFLNTRIMQRFTASDWGSDQWDGILGLASSATHSVHQVNSPFRNLVTQNLLDHNVFSLWLPRDAIEQGELMLGGSNPGIYQGEFRSVPWLTSTENPTNATAWLSGRYRVAANAIDIGSATTRLDGYEAVLETDYPLIGLPRVMMDRIHHHLNFTLAGGPDMPLAIACQDRALLPNITITLANHEFTLTPFDYTLEVDLDKSQMLCLSLFGFREHMPEKTISLGSAFLRNWYTTFDADKRTVAFAALSRTPRVSRGRFANVQ